MAPIMALIPNIFKATSMSLLFVSTAAKLRSLDSKRSWASLPTKTPFRCGFYLNLHQMDKHIELFKVLFSVRRSKDAPRWPTKHNQQDVATSETSISAIPAATCETMEINQGKDGGKLAQALRSPI